MRVLLASAKQEPKCAQTIYRLRPLPQQVRWAWSISRGQKYVSDGQIQHIHCVERIKMAREGN